MKNRDKIKTINWLKKPEKHDYIAAISYLSLLFTEAQAKQFGDQLKRTSITHFKAKDIFRASSLSLLGISDKQIKNYLKKIKDGDFISPILLVRVVDNNKVIVADGYHRLCAVYRFNEDGLIPCKIV